MDESDLVRDAVRDSPPRAANGDDAAPFAVAGGIACIGTDCTVAGIHAPLQLPARLLGRRAAARAASDIAAMGAAPSVATCAVVVPAGDFAGASEAVAGVRERLAEQGCLLVGGDVASGGPGSPLTLVVTVVGQRSGTARRALPRPRRHATDATSGGGAFVSRAGMRPGDVLLVTGALGAAMQALASSPATIPEPPDRVRAARALAPFAGAIVDVSDGVARDVGQLAAASGCGVVVDLERLPLAPGVDDPVAAAGFGDDYELLVAIPPDLVPDAHAALHLHDPSTTLHAIGEATAVGAGVEFRRDGQPVMVPAGHVHG